MPKTVWARQHQPISLPCGIQSTDSDDYALEWRKDAALIFNAFGNETGHTSLALQGRIARSKNLGLTIHSVLLEDQGSYTCSVIDFGRSSKNSTQHGSVVQLVVRAPPIIRHPSENNTILYSSPGENFQVNCESEGLPSPQVRWTRKDSIISQTKSLTIIKAKPSDQGEYVCNVRNEEGSTQISIQLQLYQGPKLDYALTNKTVIEGSSVFWKCSAHGHPNNIIYHWAQNGRSINTLEIGLRGHIQDGDFGIMNVRRADQGWYECEAGNGHLPNAKTRAYLTVQYKPELKNTALSRQILVFGEGTNSSLNCEMDANPPVSQTFWSKNGLVLRNDKPQNDTQNNYRIYSFKNVSTEDAGMYACWSENVVGRSSIFEFHVIVASALKFSHEPPPEAKIDAGEHLSVECEGFGDPPPIQYWLRGMKKISGSVLRIRNVSFEDSGLYQCVLSNSIVTASRNFNLKIRNTRPQCIEDVHMECNGETGFEIKFKHGYDGGHPQHFRLFYRRVSDNSTMDFNSWETTREFEEASVRLEALERFAKYQFFIEIRNIIGVTNCTLKDQYTCSILNAPQNLHLSDNKRLGWSAVEEASGYRISYQLDNKRPFEFFDEVADTEANIGRLSREEFVNFYVQATKAPFQPSQPSQIYSFKQLESQQPSTLAFASLIIVVVGLIVALIYFFFGRRRRRKRKSKSAVGGTQFENEGDLNVMRKEDFDWLRTESGRSEFDDEDEACGFGIPHQTPHVVNEMLKHKYIYSMADDTLERIRQDLHIEKLKDEFKHSALL